MARALQRGDHLADRSVHELDFDEQRRGWCAHIIQITALYDRRQLRPDEFLADTDGLEIHAKDGRNRRAGRAVMLQALDFVEDRIDLQRIVALNILEAGGIVV